MPKPKVTNQPSHETRQPHQTLYRKYRPQNFEEVIGQEQVLKALKGAIAQNNISHAYLFAGGRGTGKTSVARIFARALNITDSDTYEIDAASNRGIDDVRELREGVAVLPLNSAYKVYIIDEVHMLTKEAFNALLKTLEEPPAHALFILATTELERLPATIVSRCQVLNFTKPSAAVLSKVVESTSVKEGYAIEPAGAELIALIGDGSFRDTLGTLQKVISNVQVGANGGQLSDKKVKKSITYEDVAASTGAPSASLIEDVLKAIAMPGEVSAMATGLQAIEAARERNIDSKIFLDMIIARARSLLIAKIRKESVPIEINSGHILSLLQAYGNIGTTATPMLAIELALIKAHELRSSSAVIL